MDPVWTESGFRCQLDHLHLRHGRTSSTTSGFRVSICRETVPSTGMAGRTLVKKYQVELISTQFRLINIQKLGRWWFWSNSFKQPNCSLIPAQKITRYGVIRRVSAALSWYPFLTPTNHDRPTAVQTPTTAVYSYTSTWPFQLEAKNPD